MLLFFLSQFTEKEKKLNQYAKPLPHDTRCVFFPDPERSVPGEGLMNMWAPLQ